LSLIPSIFHNGGKKQAYSIFIPSACDIYILDECTPLWGEPDRVHVQNMEQLNAYTSSEPEATDYDITKRIHTRAVGSSRVEAADRSER